MTAEDVLEIKGKVSTALCYAKVVEEEVKKVADKGFSIVRNGSILLVGSDKAVADAKN